MFTRSWSENWSPFELCLQALLGRSLFLGGVCELPSLDSLAGTGSWEEHVSGIRSKAVRYVSGTKLAAPDDDHRMLMRRLSRSLSLFTDLFLNGLIAQELEILQRCH